MRRGDLPLLQVLTISLRPGDRLFSTSLALIPDNATLQSYSDVLFNSDFAIWIYNSLAISTVAAILGVCFAVPAGYAFSRSSSRAAAPASCSCFPRR